MLCFFLWRQNETRLKEKAEVEEGWRASSSPFVPLPWDESAILQSLLLTVAKSLCMWSTLVWEVFTISIIFHILPTRLPNCSSLWYYKSVQINMNSKSHCCDLNLGLPETLAISIISFLLLLDHIRISVCFCYLISKIHQLQQDSNCSFGKWNYLNHSNIRTFYMFYYLQI